MGRIFVSAWLISIGLGTASYMLMVQLDSTSL